MKISGRVFTGMGVGQEYISMAPYQNKIEEIAGFKPFPGTLNLRSQDDVEKILAKVDSSRIDSFSFEGGEFSGIDVYMAELQGLKVAVLRMDITDYGPEVVEVVAEENLRERFDLEDGDKVELIFQ